MVEQAYGTVQYDRLCEQVARQLQDMIASGTLEEGSRLPPERELAENFGVSRTAIREAIKVLSTRGLVEVLPGKGSFVTTLNSEAISHYMQLLIKVRSASLLQFHEIRTALEVAAAGSAVERATVEERAQLRNLSEGIDECLAANDKEGFIDMDVAFHAKIAELSHNPLYQAVLEPIMGTLADSRRITYHIENSPKRGQYFHHMILNCIEQSDVDGARAIMRQHMEQVEKDIQIAETTLLNTETS
jgi:GntR family transcriptional repressor for pyruvate dehydrogenase complex